MTSQETVHDILKRLGVTFEEIRHHGDGSHSGTDWDHDEDDDDHDHEAHLEAQGHHDDDDGDDHDHHDDEHDDDDDDHDDHIPAAHPKCLFLENRDGRKHYLIITPKAKRLDMAKLAQQLGARRLSFGSKKPLKEWLNATPGTLSPFSIVHDTQQKVTVILDQEVLQFQRLGFHPDDDTSTLVISPQGLTAFLSAASPSYSTMSL